VRHPRTIVPVSPRDMNTALLRLLAASAVLSCVAQAQLLHVPSHTAPWLATNFSSTPWAAWLAPGEGERCAVWWGSRVGSSPKTASPPRVLTAKPFSETARDSVLMVAYALSAWLASLLVRRRHSPGSSSVSSISLLTRLHKTGPRPAPPLPTHADGISISQRCRMLRYLFCGGSAHASSHSDSQWWSPSC
jgi:hypothetical protein